MEAHSDISTEQSMPLILVSARDLNGASVLVSELVEEKVKENGEVKTETVPNRKPWRIINKYYRVDVEMYSLADDEPLPPALADQIEAHIIYISDDEEQDEDDAAELAERRRAAAGESRADVRLLVTAGARAPPALLAWARRRRYELVPLRQTPADDDDDDRDDDAPFPETYGAERVRAALHAHAWRGLRRLDRPARSPLAPRDALAPTSSDDDYSGGEDSESDEFAAVERAEEFAEALGALGEAGAELRGLERDERRRRAERVVAAFCRALGSDLPAL